MVNKESLSRKVGDFVVWAVAVPLATPAPVAAGTSSTGFSMSDMVVRYCFAILSPRSNRETQQDDPMARLAVFYCSC